MFNLEKAIREWKTELAGKPALDDTYISELEAVLRDEIADRVRGGESEEAAFRASKAGMGEAGKIGSEFSKVRRPRGWGQRLGWHYVRISVRKIRRQKGYSAINIAGLAVGLACCILMMLWIRDERGFDRFHVDRDSIYRVITETKTDQGILLDARTATPLGPALKAALPEVAEYCRYFTNKMGYGLQLGSEIVYGDAMGVADPSFFTLFSFPFVSGDPKTALTAARSIVITERLARKHFGAADPMGKSLVVGRLRHPYAVTGVIKDVPENSHLRFDCVIPIINIREYGGLDFEDWKSGAWFSLYVRLAPGTDPASTGPKMVQLLRDRAPAVAGSLRLQSLKDIHLKSNFAFDSDNTAPGSVSTLKTFSIAAAAVLLLACINFMNLATARSANRAKEVGLRKVTGARRSDLIRQFLGESLVLSFFSLVLAVALVELALPLFNTLSGKHLALGRLFGAGFFAAVVGLTALTGLLAGSYPALFLSAFQPAKVLKDKGLGGGRGPSVLRKCLIVAQFALTVFLLIGTLVMDKQLRFIRGKDLGFDTHQVLSTLAGPPSWKEALLANPDILNVSRSLLPGQEIRGNDRVSWEGKNPETAVTFLPGQVDEFFLDTFRLAMASGRFFDRNRPSDPASAVVINETAARAMGPDSPLGKTLTFEAVLGHAGRQTLSLIVIGVVKDFHQTSLHGAIQPMLFMHNRGEGIRANVRIAAARVDETLKFLEKTWKTFMPDLPFTFEFLDDKIDGLYKSERKVRSILGLFAVLAVFTAGLGLFGLASFIAERKTKEIGIRKVLGASIRSLILMQTREFAVWVLLANLVAWPAAYFAVGRWLQGFAYHVRPGVAPAVVAAVFSLAVALLAVGYKAFRSSLANPVDSLKYE